MYTQREARCATDVLVLLALLSTQMPAQVPGKCCVGELPVSLRNIRGPTFLLLGQEVEGSRGWVAYSLEDSNKIQDAWEDWKKNVSAENGSQERRDSFTVENVQPSSCHSLTQGPGLNCSPPAGAIFSQECVLRL